MSFRSKENKEKFVPYEKQSKKNKRKIDKQKRRDWGELHPSSKIIPDSHKEKRDKEKYKDKEKDAYEALC